MQGCIKLQSRNTCARGKEMSDFKFNCPHCDQCLETEGNLAGLLLQCPNCGREITVPLAASESNTPICPQCAKPLSPDAVLCVQCGYNLRTGQCLTTAFSTSETDKGKYAWIKIAGILAGLAIAIIAVTISFRQDWFDNFRSLKAHRSSKMAVPPENPEDKAFATAREKDTPEAYASYREQFPEGKHTQEASIRGIFCQLKNPETRESATQELVKIGLPAVTFLRSALQNDTPDAPLACGLIAALAEKKHPFVTVHLAHQAVNSSHLPDSLTLRLHLFRRSGGEEGFRASQALLLIDKNNPDSTKAVAYLTSLGVAGHRACLNILGRQAIPDVLWRLKSSLAESESSKLNDMLWQFLESHKWQPSTPEEEIIVCMRKRDWEGLYRIADQMPSFLESSDILNLGLVALKVEGKFPPALKKMLDKNDRKAAEQAFRRIFHYSVEHLWSGEGTRMERFLRLVKFASAFGGTAAVECLADAYVTLEWEQPFRDDYYEMRDRRGQIESDESERQKMTEARNAILAAQTVLTDGQFKGGGLEYHAWRQGIADYKVPLTHWDTALPCNPRPSKHSDLGWKILPWFTITIDTQEGRDFHTNMRRIVTTTTKKGLLGILLENATAQHAAVLLRARRTGSCYAARIRPKQSPVFFAFPEVLRKKGSENDEWHEDYYEVSYVLSDNPNIVIKGVLKALAVPDRHGRTPSKYADTAKARSPYRQNHPQAVWAVMERGQMPRNAPGFIGEPRNTTPAYAFTKPITLVIMTNQEALDWSRKNK